MADTLTPLRPRHDEFRTQSVTNIRAVRIARSRERHHMEVSYLLSSLLVLATAFASAVGFFNSGIFRDPPMTAGNAQGTALVLLVVGVPLLIASMIMTARGSARAGIVWLASLGYVLYNSVLFTFAVTFNRLFLVYVAMFALSLWSLISMLLQVDANRLRERFPDRTPVRWFSIYLVAASLLFAVAWMADIVPALVNHTLPNSLDKTVMLTNPIEVVDLSITLPLLALAGVWIWRRRPWGYLLAGVLTVMLTVETLGVAVDQTFGHRSDPTQSLAAVPLMVALTVIGLVVSVVYMQFLTEDEG